MPVISGLYLHEIKMFYWQRGVDISSTALGGECCVDRLTRSSAKFPATLTEFKAFIAHRPSRPDAGGRICRVDQPPPTAAATHVIGPRRRRHLAIVARRYGRNASEQRY